MLHWLLVPEELLAGGEDSLSASISPSVTHSAPVTVTLPCSEARLMCTDKAQHAPACGCTARHSPAHAEHLFQANDGKSVFV